MARLGFWWWFKAWLSLVFSRAVWCSWLFCLLYLLILWTLLEDFAWWKIPLQALGLLVMAMLFSTMGLVAARLELRRRKRQEPERNGVL